MSKLGSIESIAHMVPGMKKVTDNPEAMAKAEDEIKKSLAIINSMTVSERRIMLS